MGRPKYSTQERDQILVTFIRAAREIIQDEGIEKVSIRKVANITGLNSATMYLYFPNADALITMACMSYLEKYCRTLAADMPLMQSKRDAFVHSWEIFSKYAFADPQIFRHLFYTEHSFDMGELIDTYWTIFQIQWSICSTRVILMREVCISFPHWRRNWAFRRSAPKWSMSWWCATSACCWRSGARTPTAWCFPNS